MTSLIQMISKTALDGEGIFQLGLVQDFFKKMNIPLSQIKVVGDFFDLDERYSTYEQDFPRFHKVVADGLCPAVKTVINSEPHGVVIDQFIGVDRYNKPYYNCKNTNRNERNIRVGYSNHPDIYPLYEAVLIQFERK